MRTDEEVKKSSDPSVRYLSKPRLDILSRVLVVFASVASILNPVFLLFLVPMARFAMVLTALAFVFTFSSTIIVATEARVQEVLIGSAA